MSNIKPIEGFSDYLITDHGEVYSLKSGSSHKLAACPDTFGYPIVGLARDGVRHMKCVHQLVLMHFVGPRPSPKHVTRHLDGNPQNNQVSNLAWGTQSENIKDRKRHGTEPYQKGEANHGAKLTEDQVQTILDRSETGESDSSIAADFDVNRTCINRIRNGRRWNHVSRDVTYRKAA